MLCYKHYIGYNKWSGAIVVIFCCVIIGQVRSEDSVIDNYVFRKVDRYKINHDDEDRYVWSVCTLTLTDVQSLSTCKCASI